MNGLRPGLRLEDFDLAQRVCDCCEWQQPTRARHCKLCQCCYRRFDHHCPWLGRCVAEDNHRYFVLFLLVHSGMALFAVTQLAPMLPRLDEFSGLMQLLFALVFSGLCLTGVMFAILAGMHLHLAARNRTTWEMAGQPSYLQGFGSINPFDQGMPRNLIAFFSGTRRDYNLMLRQRALRQIGQVV